MPFSFIDSRSRPSSQIDQEQYEKIKDFVLGEEYDLSLVLCDPQLSQDLNKKYRQKDYPTDVLSFPYSDTEGEIFLDTTTALNKSSDFDRSLDNFLLFLFIHGLFHLKGYNHGAIMEAEESRVRNHFGV
jgi:probable rRNA maturation factor